MPGFQRWLVPLSFVFVVCHDVVACQDEPASSPASDKPMACTRDEECQAPPCGPCTANARLTADMMTQTCVVNPCPRALAHCNADKVCAVKCVACANEPPN